jgi:hypothetical protein
MFELSNASTLWVNLTNILLGMATILCLGIVIYAAAKEVIVRAAKKSKAQVREHDAHVFEVPELGLTMTDGGEKLYDDDERAFG